VILADFILIHRDFSRIVKGSTVLPSGIPGGNLDHVPILVAVNLDQSITTIQTCIRWSHGTANCPSETQ
jgi:hypothetical protein